MTTRQKHTMASSDDTKPNSIDTLINHLLPTHPRSQQSPIKHRTTAAAMTYIHHSSKQSSTSNTATNNAGSNPSATFTTASQYPSLTPVPGSNQVEAWGSIR